MKISKVITVNLMGGIIGFLASSPKKELNQAIQRHNANGWRVVQIIPADSGNFFLILLRILLLLVTFFLFTFSNGYYIVLEKEVKSK